MNVSFSQKHRVPAAAHQFVFDAQATPALRVGSGATVVIETLDCFCGRLTAQSPTLRDDRDVLTHIGGRYNPVNRPVYVAEAEPGDVLAVEILDVALGQAQDFAVTHVAHDWARSFGGDAFADHVAPQMMIARLAGNEVTLPIGGRPVTLKARPMIGTIGTAPNGDAVSSLLYGPAHGGNLDCPLVRPGATVLLPVNVPGALLSLGDLHALMGEGEITGTALEAEGAVTLRLSVLKGSPRLTLPRLSDGERLGSLGCASKASLHDNIRDATLDLAACLGTEYGFSAGDALQLVNLFGRITVNQSVAADNGGWSSVLVHIAKADLALFRNVA